MKYAIIAYLGVAVGYAISTLLTQLYEIDRCDRLRGEKSGPVIRALTVIGCSLTWPIPACSTIALVISLRRRKP